MEKQRMRWTMPLSSPWQRCAEIGGTALRLAVGAMFWVGCSGEISGPASGEHPTTTGHSTTGGATGGGQVTGVPDTIDPSGTLPLDANAAGPRPLMRLSRREYNNTVHDLLGDDTRPADTFADDKQGEFLYTRSDLVSNHDAELLQSAAESLAAAAVKNLATLLPCASSANEACARTFLQTVGRRAFRRPLTAGETDRLMKLYEAGRGKLALGFGDTMGLLVEAMLQSPAFLYHWERDPSESPVHEGDVVALGAFEVASRLSYFIWGSLPDDDLLDAATKGELSTDAQIEAQARRLLADPRRIAASRPSSLSFSS